VDVSSLRRSPAFLPGPAHRARHRPGRPGDPGRRYRRIRPDPHPRGVQRGQRRASVPAVRTQLIAQQRKIIAAVWAAGNGIVAEGRDIGTVSPPRPPSKVYLTASAAVRALRRTAELSAGRRSPPRRRGRPGPPGPQGRRPVGHGGRRGVRSTRPACPWPRSSPGSWRWPAPAPARVRYGRHDPPAAGLQAGPPDTDAAQADGPTPWWPFVGRQRGQVDAGQPDSRQPPGGRGGRARRDPRPGHLRRQLARPGLTLVDTGGWEPASRHRFAAARVAAQARVAVDAADAVLFVVDAVVG